MSKLIKENLRRLLPLSVILLLFFGIFSYLASKDSTGLIQPWWLSPLLYGFPYVGGVLISFAAFGFLRDREQSELFLGLPYTRSRLFFGILLSELLIGAAVILISLLSSCLALNRQEACYLLFPHVPMVLLFFLLMTLRVLSAFNWGQSLSGTRFFSLVWGGLLLLLPGLVYGALGSLQGKLGIQFIGPMQQIGSSYDSTALELFASTLLGGYADTRSMFELPAYMYNTAVSLLYAAGSYLSFLRRKAELSGSPAPGKARQRLMSCLASGILLLFAGSLTVNNSGGWEIFTLFILSLLCFMSLELMASRSFMVALKSLWCYGVTVLAVLVLVGAGVLGFDLAKRNLPRTREDIAYVQLEGKALLRKGSYPQGANDYQADRLNRLRFTEAYLLDAVIGETDPQRGLYSSREDDSLYMQVKLKNGLRYSGYFMLPREDLERLFELPEVKACLDADTLPESEQFIGFNGRELPGNLSWDMDRLKELYEDYLQEVEGKQYFHRNSKEAAMPIVYLEPYIKEGSSLYAISIPLYASVTPETCKAYIQLVNAVDPRQKLDPGRMWGMDVELFGPSGGGGIGIDPQGEAYRLLCSLPLATGEEESFLKLSYRRGAGDERYQLFLAGDAEIFRQIAVLEGYDEEFVLTKFE